MQAFLRPKNIVMSDKADLLSKLKSNADASTIMSEKCKPTGLGNYNQIQSSTAVKALTVAWDDNSTVKAITSCKVASQPSSKGWKIIAGVKQYTTIRNGKAVKGCGQDAFRLALGDSGLSSKRRADQNDKENHKRNRL